MKIMVKKKSIMDFALVLLYKLVLDLSSIKIVYPLYHYSGFVLDLSWFKLFLSYLFMFMALPLFLAESYKTSDTILKMLFLFMVVPFLSYFGLSGGSVIFCCMFIFCFCLTAVLTKNSYVIKFCSIKGVNPVLILSLSLFTCFVYAVFIKLNGISINSILQVINGNEYELRENINYDFPMLPYFFQWQGNVVNMFLFGLFLFRKNYLGVVVVVSLQIMIFFLSGQKSLIINPMLGVFVLMAVRSKKVLSCASVLLTLIVSGSSFYYYLYGSIIPVSVFVRRALMVPAKINFNYYDFFSTNELMFLAESHLSFGMVENPYAEYGLNSANLMGLKFLENAGTHMNVGYLGDAYMNFGFGGMVIFSLIFASILIVVDSLSLRKPLLVTTFTLIVPFFGFINGALFTNMLTGGVLLSLVIMFLYNHRESKVSRKIMLDA